MRTRRNNGYALILAVMILSLTSIALFLLTATSKSLNDQWILQSTRTALDCVISSAAEWIDANTEQLTKMENKASVQLDIRGLGLKDATCDITVIKGQSSEFVITASYIHKRLGNVKHTERISFVSNQ